MSRFGDTFGKLLGNDCDVKSDFAPPPDSANTIGRVGNLNSLHVLTVVLKLGCTVESPGKIEKQIFSPCGKKYMFKNLHLNRFYAYSSVVLSIFTFFWNRFQNLFFLQKWNIKQFPSPPSTQPLVSRKIFKQNRSQSLPPQRIWFKQYGHKYFKCSPGNSIVQLNVRTI